MDRKQEYARLQPAATELQVMLGLAARGAIQQLLSSKHLYQTVQINWESLLSEAISRFSEDFRAEASRVLELVGEYPWLILSPTTLERPWPLPWQLYERRGPGFLPQPATGVFIGSPDARTYCVTCARTEPFNPLQCFDVLSTSSVAGRTEYPSVNGNISLTNVQVPVMYRLDDKDIQKFSLSMQCQGCKGVPEIFLIAREGMKVRLAGRTPMEHAAIPPEIPKRIGKHYASSVLAHQSGQTLPALFMLRVVIEQWVAPLGKPDEKSDKILERYQEQLPVDFKQRFPSLVDWYGKLSAAMHAANADAKLYDDACAAIVKHFDARRLFDLGELVPPTTAVEGNSGAENAEK